MIIIVNVHGMKANTAGITYCGRACNGWTAGVLANQFRGPEEQRNQICEQYRMWLWNKIKGKKGPEWEAIRSLAAMGAMGETIKLGCWCAPKRCHTESIRNAIKWAQKQLVDDPDFCLLVESGGVMGK